MHVKIKADANPYDPDWKDYFESRSLKSKEQFYMRPVITV